MHEFSLKTPSGTRYIGPNHPTFIIAEMSGNHQHSFDRALKLIDVAHNAGVDAIKIQTYTADTLTIDCDNKYFQVNVNDAWAGKTLHQLYTEAHTPWEWQAKLKEYAESKGLLLFSTPFDVTAVDFLEDLNMPLYKISSFETEHIPLLKKVAKTGKPVIISRGLTPLSTVEKAIKILKDNGCQNIVVLHCVSSYPAKLDQMNLSTIPHISKKLGVLGGLSDHSLGIIAPITATSLGACVIEKHFTFSRAEGGPDAAFSLEPDELKEMVQAIRSAQKAVGTPSLEVELGESENLVFRQSVFVVKPVKEGETFSEKNIRIIRPGFGMKPYHFEEIIGKRSLVDLEIGTPLLKDHIHEFNLDSIDKSQNNSQQEQNYFF